MQDSSIVDTIGSKAEALGFGGRLTGEESRSMLSKEVTDAAAGVFGSSGI